MVKDATESTARVELHSTCQTISVDRQRLTTVCVGSDTPGTALGTPLWGRDSPGGPSVGQGQPWGPLCGVEGDPLKVKTILETPKRVREPQKGPAPPPHWVSVMPPALFGVPVPSDPPVVPAGGPGAPGVSPRPTGGPQCTDPKLPCTARGPARPCTARRPRCTTVRGDLGTFGTVWGYLGAFRGSKPRVVLGSPPGSHAPNCGVTGGEWGGFGDSVGTVWTNGVFGVSPGSRTPHYGSQTPLHDGSRTPAQSGAWDPNNPNTPSR